MFALASVFLPTDPNPVIYIPATFGFPPVHTTEMSVSPVIEAVERIELAKLVLTNDDCS
jgi:hypothetical protein